MYPAHTHTHIPNPIPGPLTLRCRLKVPTSAHFPFRLCIMHSSYRRLAVGVACSCLYHKQNGKWALAGTFSRQRKGKGPRIGFGVFVCVCVLGTCNQVQVLVCCRGDLPYRKVQQERRLRNLKKKLNITLRTTNYIQTGSLAVSTFSTTDKLVEHMMLTVCTVAS